jgi:hypothetical protein
VKCIAIDGNLEGIHMKSFFSRIGRIGLGSSNLDRYYQGVVGRGAGYPTLDEARQDYQRVLAQRHIPRSM